MFPIRFCRILFLFLIFLFPPVLTQAQHQLGIRTLDWTPVKKMRVDNESKDVLHFQSASYSLNTLLPIYYEILEIDDHSDYTLDLYNQVFQPLDGVLIRNIDNLDSIPTMLNIESKVAISRKKRFLQISIIPLRRNALTGQVEMLTSFGIRLVPGPAARKSLPSSIRQYASQSVLASGKWVRIKVQQDGIYSLTYEQLSELGLSNPANVRIYGNSGGMLPVQNNQPRPDDLTENATYFEKGSDGAFNQGDYILFFGQGPDTWVYDTANTFFNRSVHDYSSYSYYYLTSDLGPGQQVQPAPAPPGPANRTVTQYDDLRHHELEDINLLGSGQEWYGEHFDIVTEQTFNLQEPALIPAGEMMLRVSTVARASGTTSFQVSVNGTTIGTLEMAATSLSSETLPYAQSKDGIFAFTPSADVHAITLRYMKNEASAQGWLNFFTLNARVPLTLAGSSLIFRDRQSAGAGNISEFRIANAQDAMVWDITHPTDARIMNTSLEGSTLTFTTGTDSLRTFVAFTGKGMTPIMEGEDVGPVPNQNLHGLQGRNYVVISHPDFLSSARMLAAHRHDHDGLDTVVVTPGQIYHEFSSGKPDVSAMRDFLKMLYDRAGTEEEMPRYVLLFGDGSYRNKGTDENNTNFILTYQSGNSLSPVNSFVTDDFFALLDDDEGGANGLMDIGVGRFPVSSREQARDAVQKTISYDQPDKMGDWRNFICFIGDDGDGRDGILHMAQADELANYVAANYPGFSIGKIYLDAYPQTTTPSGDRYPDVNEALNQRVNKGALIINYTGHGGENGLAHERILTINDIVSWKNRDKLPLFMTATCEFSRFDDYEHTSAGELVFLNPDGGGIALFSTTRLVFAEKNHALSVRFYQHIFTRDEQNRHYRLGDVMRLTKINTSASINKRNFTLLGDPGLSLAYPKNSIRVLTVNGKDITQSLDTLKALGKVTITGQVEDELGNPMNGFNGIVYPTIYDKESEIKTLSNDGDPVMTFTLRDRIIYKGKASVRQGLFSIEFIVPKDISYNYDHGKLSFYAADNAEDASGASDQVIIGGSADTVANDGEGPEIRIYMNDEHFVSGGLTDATPQLLVYVTDSSGINTIGSGIGHDLTAIIDQQTSQVIVLNDFYEADTDSYQSGTIRYPLKSLEAGQHQLKVKVWDVYNNSSEDDIEFVVNTESELVLKHVLNYPNPFTTHTQFFFEHNQPDMDMDVLIQVFTVSGKLVKTLERHVTSTGYRSAPIDWDGLDDYGSRIGRGVYIYRLKVRTSMGQTAEKFEKLVILN
jgi:hypothetical protein